MLMQHVCGTFIEARIWDMRAEMIVDAQDQYGNQVNECPGCGSELSETYLFPVDFEPVIFETLMEVCDA